jgi:hypothetical protein
VSSHCLAELTFSPGFGSAPGVFVSEFRPVAVLVLREAWFDCLSRGFRAFRIGGSGGSVRPDVPDGNRMFGIRGSVK